MYSLIYCATNNLNNKKYIGQTKHSLSLRKNEHINEAKRDKGFYFHKALRKYNYNFTWEVLETCLNQEESDIKEKFYIAFFDTFNSNKGYNLTSGGDFCNKVKYSTEEIEFVLSKRRELKGRKIILELFNKEFNRNIKNVHSIIGLIDKYLSIEEEEKIKFKIKSNNSVKRIETEQSKSNRSLAQLGKTHSEETIKKLRKIKSNFKHSKESIIQMTLNNKRRINFTEEQKVYIIESRKNKISRSKIIFLLNEKFGFKINVTSTCVINRIIKESLEVD